MKLKSLVENAVLTEGQEGIENRGKMIRHDWMLRRKWGRERKEQAPERKNPAD
jgi:hypothetical protein